MDSKALLGASYLFSGLDHKLIEGMAALAVTRRVASGETLFFKGDEGDALYGVLNGKLRISATAPSGKEVVLSIMERGDVFGEIALLDGLPRTADVTAVEPTELLCIQRRDFIGFLAHQPALAVHLLGIVCRRLRQTNERVEDIAFLDLPARLAKRLLAMDEDLRGRVGDALADQDGIRISQNELANFLGTSRESVNKHLQVWRKEGWIDLARSRVFVKQRDPLEDVVEDGMFE